MPCVSVSILFWSCLCPHRVIGVILYAPVSHYPLANVCTYALSFPLFLPKFQSASAVNTEPKPLFLTCHIVARVSIVF